jgi:hypothetical protein
MTASKTSWRVNTTSGIQTGTQAFPAATNFTSIDLVQQRIRMFNLTFVTVNNPERAEFLSY